MVAIDIAKIAKTVAGGAKNVLKGLKENPAEGSIFDAAKKLGINSKDDLKAGLSKLKENPKETIASAVNTLEEKGFKLGGTKQAGETEEAGAVGEAQPKKIGGLLGKLGIEKAEDIPSALQLMSEDPTGSAQHVGETIGLSEGTTEKIGKFFKNFSA